MEAVGHGRWICGGPGRGSGPLHEASRASGRLCPGGTGIAEVGGQGKALASTQSTQIPYEGALHIHPDTPYQSCKNVSINLAVLQVYMISFLVTGEFYLMVLMIIYLQILGNPWIKGKNRRGT